MTGLKNVTWKIEVLNMTLTQEITDRLTVLQETYKDIDNFVILSDFTAILEVGAQIKVTGYAASKEGFIVSDNAAVTIAYGPHPELAGFSSSYYIIAEEGLTFNLYTEYPQCPNSERMITPFTKADWKRLTCTLYDITRTSI